VKEIRQRGLWIGVDIHESTGTARAACKQLMAAGVLAKETHEQTIRFAPPLTTTAEELDWLLERANSVLGAI
jgi:ornithine--oxo-acid transaminase